MSIGTKRKYLEVVALRMGITSLEGIYFKEDGNFYEITDQFLDLPIKVIPLGKDITSFAEMLIGKCPICGTLVKEGEPYCGNCGTPIEFN